MTAADGSSVGLRDDWPSICSPRWTAHRVDLERLHRIVVYRETGLGLESIWAILDDSTADVPGALRAQRAQVTERIDRLQQLSADLERSKSPRRSEFTATLNGLGLPGPSSTSVSSNSSTSGSGNATAHS